MKNSNRFLALKLPSAYFSGVRVSAISDRMAQSTVTYRWMNQNPFNSLFWAIQGMAAELVTGILLMKKIKESGRDISMLLVSQEGNFHKKAKGKITFTCEQGTDIDAFVEKAIATETGQQMVLKSVGFDQSEDMVCDFQFTWSIKLKV